MSRPMVRVLLGLALLVATAPAPARSQAASRIIYTRILPSGLAEVRSLDPDSPADDVLLVGAGTGGATMPTFSGDGRRIAYSSRVLPGTSPMDVWVARADGFGPLRVTITGGVQANDSVTHEYPSLNRDGSRVVAWEAVTGATPVYGLYVVNTDGLGLGQVIYPSAQVGGLNLTLNVRGDPHWSPLAGDDRIVYSGWVDGQPSTPGIYMIRADGTGNTQLVTPPQDWSGVCLYQLKGPRWSPDAARVAFVQQAQCLTGFIQNYYYSFWTLNLNTNQLAQFYPDPTTSPLGFQLSGPNAITRLAWSPDGTRLVYVMASQWFAEVPVAWDLHVVNADGTGHRQLTTGGKSTISDWGPALDVTPPVVVPGQVAVLINDAAAFTRDPNVLLRFNVQDNVGVIQMRLANALFAAALVPAAQTWEPFASTKAWRLEAGDGSKMVYAQFRDAAGNASLVYSNTIALDTTPPSSSVTALPPTVNTITFTVAWSGGDATSGVATYDVQVRDEATGPWTDWLTGLAATSALFTGQDRHTYYFRSRAADRAGNVEAYPGGDGDAWTKVDLSAPPSATPTPTATPAASPTATPTPTPTWVPSEVTIARGSGGGELVSNDGSVRLAVPESSLPAAMAGAIFRFAPSDATPVATPSPGSVPNIVAATPVFELTARDAASGAGFQGLAAPLTLTVSYQESPALVERGLVLYRRPTPDDLWTTAGILSQSLDTANNRVRAQVITLSQFVILGPPTRWVYLPFLARSSGGW